MSQPVVPYPTEVALRSALAAAISGRNDSVVVHGQGNQIVRGEVLREVLINAGAAPGPCITRLVLWNARINGWLALDGLELKLTPSFIDCTFDTGIRLTDARAIGFEVIGGSVPEVRADRLTTSGSLLLRKALSDPSYIHEQPDTAPLGIATHLLLSGAKIHGNLDLRGCQLGTEGVVGLEKVCLLADGVTVEGNLLLSDGLRSNGEIRLNGCTILRNLDCGGAVMTNPGGFSLSAAGGLIHGSVYLTSHGDQDFTSEGEFRLDGATVDGDIDATAAKFMATAFVASTPATIRPAGTPITREHCNAVAADGLKVGADLRFTDGFTATGVVSLINARIGADFKCTAGRFELPGEEALYADGITVGGATFLTGGAATNGLLRFVQATLSQGFFIEDAIFDRDGTYENYLGDDNVSAGELGHNVCGIYAPGAKIDGTFYFGKISKTGVPGRVVWLSVQYAAASTIEDLRASWETLDRLDIRDCDYQTIVGVTDDIDWRLARLDREYIGSFAGAGRWCAGLAALIGGRNQRLEEARERFAPQPYLKLAQVLRTAGYEGAATRILIHLERNRNCFSGMSRWRQILRWLLDLFLRYGFSPFYPVLFLIGWMAVSAFCFDSAFQNGRLIAKSADPAAKDRPLCRSAPKAEDAVCFNRWIYAADTLVPVVDLNQKKNFVFLNSSYLLIFNTFFGWAMTSLFAAGVTGLTRPSSGG